MDPNYDFYEDFHAPDEKTMTVMEYIKAEWMIDLEQCPPKASVIALEIIRESHDNVANTAQKVVWALPLKVLLRNSADVD